MANRKRHQTHLQPGATEIPEAPAILLDPENEKNQANAQAAYQRIEASLAEVKVTDSLRLDLTDTSIAIRTVVARLRNDPQVLNMLDRLSQAGVVQQDLLGHLNEHAWALLYAAHMSNTTENLSDKVRVSSSLFERANDLRDKLVGVLRYMLGDRPEVAKAIDQAAKGKGYTVVADALWSLGGLYKKHHAFLSQEKFKYRETDADLASEYANQIMVELALPKNQDVEYWGRQADRVRTVCVRDYDKLQDAMRVCFGRDQEMALAPSLTIMVRGRPTRTKNTPSNLPIPAPVPPEAPEAPEEPKEEVVVAPA